MKYLTTLSSLLFTLALAAPHPQLSSSTGAFQLICQTSAASPAISDVQRLADHFKDTTATCFHSLGTGPDHCEVMYQNDKAGVGACGPVSLYPCHAAYDVVTQLLAFKECIQTHDGVQRVGGKALLSWGLLNVHRVEPKPTPAASVQDPDNILGPHATLVLDTPEP